MTAGITRTAIPEEIARIADSEDRKLAIRFFIFFLRIEYALKRTGFIYEKYSQVHADWDRFADSIQKQFMRDLRSDQTLRTAHEYLLTQPPRKQVLNHGDLGWSVEEKNDPVAGRELRWTLTMVRRVRNNLFHGGKFPTPDGRMSDPSRDEELLMASLSILTACLEFHSNVKSAFMETLDDRP
jgi:hypothetical protein